MARRVLGSLPALLVTLVLLVACTNDADPAPTDAAPQSSTALHADRSDGYIESSLPADEPGCSAAVGIEGDVVWAGAGGAADLDTGRAVETTTTFPIASVTKQFTATVVLLLAQDGALSVDDPLSRWVPGLPAWGAEVTIAEAMHHVSGIPDYVDARLASGVLLTDVRTRQDTFSEIAAMEGLVFPPQGEFDYSNSNYFLLGEVIEAATSRPFAEVLDELIVRPLDLAMVVDPFGWSPDNTDPHSARSYLLDPTTGEWERAGSRWELNGDGGIQTTPAELVRWADNYRTGKVGGDELLTAQLADAAEAGSTRYGAGIFEDPNGALSHGGDGAGFLTEFLISADRRTSVAVTCNGDRGASSRVRYLALALRGEWAR
jgi:CubicO group peptidase (beta-lactamase class C family)